MCAKCEVWYELRPEDEPTTFCDSCAQIIVEKMLAITPKPPNAITWEIGNLILDTLQDELYGGRISEHFNTP